MLHLTKQFAWPGKSSEEGDEAISMRNVQFSSRVDGRVSTRRHSSAHVRSEENHDPTWQKLEKTHSIPSSRTR